MLHVLNAVLFLNLVFGSLKRLGEIFLLFLNDSKQLITPNAQVRTSVCASRLIVQRIPSRSIAF